MMVKVRLQFYQIVAIIDRYIACVQYVLSNFCCSCCLCYNVMCVSFFFPKKFLTFSINWFPMATVPATIKLIIVFLASSKFGILCCLGIDHPPVEFVIPGYAIAIPRNPNNPEISPSLKRLKSIASCPLLSRNIVGVLLT